MKNRKKKGKRMNLAGVDVIDAPLLNQLQYLYLNPKQPATYVNDFRLKGHIRLPTEKNNLSGSYT
jgi:hypothetical protein